jgi:osmotically-inducible protein OsmY
MNMRYGIATGILIATAVPLGAALPAQAASTGDVRAAGSCSAASHWKLKAKPDDGRIEVEAEVDSNRVGQLWTWRLEHNGTVSARGQATTKAPSGSFTVNRRIVNASGPDTARFVARNPASGETCRGSVRL